MVEHKTALVDGLSVFYREAGAPNAPAWQAFLRERQPDTLILRGQNDIFFTAEGGEAYLRDLPNAELIRLDTGHFAVEDNLDEIVEAITRFHARRIVPSRSMRAAAVA